MPNTPFDETRPTNSILAEAGVVFVKRPRSADVIVASRIRFLRKFGHLDRLFVSWTHEPAYCVEFNQVSDISGIRNPVHFMNAYTGGIYADPFYYFRSTKLDFDTSMRAFAAKPHRAVMLASYRKPSPVLRNGIDHDLNQYRQTLALYLQERNFCDIYGRRWPTVVKISGNSREGDWQSAKREILKGYAINVAFENTIIPNYITEKIWDAIIGACLPVYHGAGNRIYELFPQGSFIEADGKSVEELGDSILAMPRDEMEARYEACLRTYLSIAREDLRSVSRTACYERTVSFLEDAIEAQAPKKARGSPWRRLVTKLLPNEHP